MEQNGQSFAWLARRVGCHRSYVSKMRAGSRPIPDWFAERASQVMNMPMDALFFDHVPSSDDNITVIEATDDQIEGAA